ncbi:hypothetical protein EIN_333940 [Entamoeba invadens IP1]|uniref:MD-2-related lipid-recognition domain-containing protein n=1 Tax=Entamoeba invadens IP1 TaxID=370355 RepID=A0A0A1UB48_ENTIV|nr:hypothetical protein EIN_333940 [Entamoeba invadens IP1]ELP92427.1 hypothetical protein EIN_333940 [Entamoeba invadens IP1]|eukprot:XP_004259198.1 hypothetical protein EIN_333940 [Entamoeba invadens IP1]
MLFICVLLALSRAAPGIIEVTPCSEEPINNDIEITQLSFDQFPYREDTNYMFNITAKKSIDNLFLTWDVEYYWGTLYISSYSYKEVSLCPLLEGGCPMRLGPNYFSAHGSIEESVTLPGWYFLKVRMTNFEEYRSCYNGWIYLY